MGKTEAGAVWLDPEKTTPYEFYQYWRNVDDRDVERFLALYTFLPLDEVRRLGQLKDKEINEAKRILAYEVTKLTHGEEAAKNAQEAARALFNRGGDESSIPSVELSYEQVASGISIIDLVVAAKLVDSKSEARRLVAQGGITLNEQRITDSNHQVITADFKEGKVIIKKGKKQYQMVKLV